MDLLRCETGFEDVLRERLDRVALSCVRARSRRRLARRSFLSFVVCVCVCECVSQVSLWRVYVCGTVLFVLIHDHVWFCQINSQ